MPGAFERLGAANYSVERGFTSGHGNAPASRLAGSTTYLLRVPNGVGDLPRSRIRGTPRPGRHACGSAEDQARENLALVEALLEWIATGDRKPRNRSRASWTITRLHLPHRNSRELRAHALSHGSLLRSARDFGAGMAPRRERDRAGWSRTGGSGAVELALLNARLGRVDAIDALWPRLKVETSVAPQA